MTRDLDTPGWKPRKSLGQNFLVNPDIARRIVDEARVGAEETILEIGPGKGALTGLLCERAHHVIAVELDPVMAEGLVTEIDASNLTVIQEDILETDLSLIASQRGIERLPIVGNLPYVISSRLTMRLVEQARSVDRVTMMVQREVGERYLAAPGSRTYGLLSALLQATGTLKRGFKVGPSAFRPKPRVESLVLTWFSSPPHDLDIPPLIRTVKAAFSRRRKQLHNALRSIAGADEDSVQEACKMSGIDPQTRAEMLGSSEFITLSRALMAVRVLQGSQA